MRVDDCLTAIYNNLAKNGCLPSPLKIRLSTEVFNEYKDSLQCLTRVVSSSNDEEYRWTVQSLLFKSARVYEDPSLTNFNIIFEKDAKSLEQAG